MVSKPVRASAPYIAEHPTALAIYCSDGRFTEPVEELLRALGHERLDTLTLPGGPGLLVTGLAQVAENQAVRKATSFLVRGHALTDAVLVAHEGCGFYRARMPRETPEAIERRQLADLRAASVELLREHPQLKVRLFVAIVRDGYVFFTPIT